MENVGDIERLTQNRVVSLFRNRPSRYGSGGKVARQELTWGNKMQTIINVDEQFIVDFFSARR